MTILSDYGTRYQSKLFNPEFLRSKDLPVPDWMERGARDRRALREGRRDGVRDRSAVSRRRLSRARPRRRSSRVNDRGGIMLDRTIFYATSGGQPGDTGFLERADGSRDRDRRHHHRRDQGRDHPRAGGRTAGCLQAGEALKLADRLGAALPADAHAHGLPSADRRLPVSDHRRGGGRGREPRRFRHSGRRLHQGRRDARG